jgi:ATP-dependent RNA helicase DeaD
LNGFSALRLSQPIMQAINSMGFEEPTPIQAASIPIALMGRDLIGQAQTGTGKTAAYGIPAIHLSDSKQDFIQGLVITPTRELAIQVGGAKRVSKLEKA